MPEHDDASLVEILLTLIPRKPPQVPRLVSKHPGAEVYSVAYSPDNNTLASASSDGIEFTKFGDSGRVFSVVFSSDNKTLASASEDGTVKLWDVSGKKQKEKGTLRRHSDVVRSVAFSPDSKTLASASNDWTIKLWDVSGDTPKEKCTLRGHSYSVMSVAFSHDNKPLASASVDDTVKLWDVSFDADAEKPTAVEDMSDEALRALLNDVATELGKRNLRAVEKTSKRARRGLGSE